MAKRIMMEALISPIAPSVGRDHGGRIRQRRVGRRVGGKFSDSVDRMSLAAGYADRIRSGIAASRRRPRARFLPLASPRPPETIPSTEKDDPAAAEEARVRPKLLKELHAKGFRIRRAHPDSHLQGQSAARGLASEGLSVRAVPHLFDLQFFRKARSQGEGGRPTGSRGLLLRRARPAQSEQRLSLVVRSRLSQRLRPPSSADGQPPDDPWRLHLDRLLCHDRRGNHRNLYAGGRRR